MASGGLVASPSSEEEFDRLISGLKEKHRLDLENLTLYAQPFKTSQLFFFGVVQYLKKSLLYMVRKGGWFMVLSILIVAFWVLLISIDGPHEKHVQEIINYSRFCLWWVALGVASSIGLGFGLHTFVLYLGPHIALFTIKASQCGRVDLKSAPYDTIQLNRGPSWLGKDCLEFGPPLFPPVTGSRVRIPLSSILPQVLFEAILWGLGTALGELPPYFIARAARLSGSKVGSMEELDATSSSGASSEDGIISTLLKKAKCWLFSHSRHLNFLTVLALASVPNPLFDLAGIMCGQFGVSFWTFFLATLLGKAIIKTHLQTVFIILVCNNQLLELLENELLWLLGLIPGFSSLLPKITVKLHTAKEKYLSAPVPSKVKGKQLNLSFNLVWNTIVWIMVLNFFIRIVMTIAQEYLKKQHKLELANKIVELKQLKAESDCASPSS
ncbi:vacuole membrane protein KMS1-like [Dioscorea cayenensis subsp. rotundata]|uniref:Vacuole membrane protein KMS1-like n=1 Tax=Dioscorea cayennensis subsp. rotundata TaxID=55577 RepID=A0AB40BST6_DIOCR|nr:vacuole membrane protein KMS1-like [Dioscorea cayenensis subsp. rotundata]